MYLRYNNNKRRNGRNCFVEHNTLQVNRAKRWRRYVKKNDRRHRET